MRRIIRSTVSVSAICLLLAVVASAQSGPNAERGRAEKPDSATKVRENGSNPVLDLAGKVAFVVVKSAAKTAWATTKFAAKDLAKPILFKLTPIVAKHSLKLTGIAAKRLLPIAIKLAVL